MATYIRYLLYCLSTMSVLLIGFCLYFLYMPFYFQKPTGIYAVGTHQYHLIDTARQEKRVNDPQHPHRELMIRAWYPAQAQSASNATTPYAPVLMDFLRKQNKSMIEKTVAFFSGLYRPVYAYCLPEAPMVKGEKGFPVIIFCHGFACSDDLYTSYCSELASHGYIIFSINHTYDSNITVFPDGRRIMGDVSAMKDLSEDARASFFNNNIETWIADVQYVLNAIERENMTESSMFYKKLDLSHIGMLGHSYGGATTIQCCRRDNRLKAGCILDGLLYGTDSDKAFVKPCLFMRAERPNISTTAKMSIEEKRALQKTLQVFTYDIDRLVKGMGADVYVIEFAKAAHMTFSDYALLQYAGVSSKMVDYDTGTVNGRLITAQVNSHLVAFFNRYLKGLRSDTLDAYRM